MKNIQEDKHTGREKRVRESKREAKHTRSWKTRLTTPQNTSGTQLLSRYLDNTVTAPDACLESPWALTSPDLLLVKLSYHYLVNLSHHSIAFTFSPLLKHYLLRHENNMIAFYWKLSLVITWISHFVATP